MLVNAKSNELTRYVSVAGCLGYDVLENRPQLKMATETSFSCWLFRL